MLKLRKVAVTGGLSCGKSTVCRIFKELGAYVVSADKIVHHLLSTDTNLGLEVVNLLGPEVMVNQKIDRSHVARLVFQNLNLLKALEEILHPAVYREIDHEYREQQQHSSPPPLFIAEIPLLFESGGKRDFDAVIAVVADDELCLRRFEETTGWDQTEFSKRMARQLSPFEKAVRADYVIVNNGTLSELHQITRELYQELIEN